VRKFVILATFAIALSTIAQTPTPPQQNILSKEESLALENIQLRSALINQEIKELQARTEETKSNIEKAHPGYTLTQTGQGFQLVKTPEPSKDAKPAPSPKK
jgi:hypothetical protein